MGLILLPLFAAWFVGAGYAVFMLYSLFTGDKPALYAIAVGVCGLLLALVYARYGLSAFRHKDEVWAFEIPMFFLLNKYAIAVFALAAVVYFFGWNFPAFTHTSAVCFLLAFSMSVGSLMGSFYSNSFLQKHDISVTY